jgi:hypothetical protein
MIEFVPATAQDIEAITRAIYGEPRNAAIRVRAFAAKLDGHVIGVGGIAFATSGERIAFCDLLPEAYRFKTRIHKAALATLRMAKEMGITRLVAERNPHEQGSDRWLRRLGFVPYDEGEGKIYVRVL